MRVVKRSILGLDILIDKGEIHTEESNFKRHKVSADRYFQLPNLVGQKDFHLPKRNFHLPNGSLVGALRHPEGGDCCVSSPQYASDEILEHKEC